MFGGACCILHLSFIRVSIYISFEAPFDCASVIIANSFRPDIAYAVSILNQFTSNPGEEHFRGIKRILRYLNGTRSYGLLFTRDNSKKNTLYGYTDADFASCFSRRSRSGFIFYSGNSPLAGHRRRIKQ
jgi:hypothetical protein